MSALLAGLIVAAVAPLPSTDPTVVHDIRVDHAGGAVDARYRVRLDLALRQTGAVSPPGAPSTLRCAWRADAIVQRDAVHPVAGTMTRALRGDGVLSGTRAGPCAGQRRAIERIVAARHATVRGRVADLAADDRTALVAELDRLHAARSIG